MNKNKSLLKKLKIVLNFILQLFAFASGLCGIFIFLNKEDIHLAIYFLVLGTFIYLTSQEYKPIILLFSDDRSIKKETDLLKRKMIKNRFIN